jgi:hypothetical protein
VPISGWSIGGADHPRTCIPEQRAQGVPSSVSSSAYLRDLVDSSCYGTCRPLDTYLGCVHAFDVNELVDLQVCQWFYLNEVVAEGWTVRQVAESVAGETVRAA